jgi:uncharacterized protein (TIGR02001 family)
MHGLFSAILLAASIASAPAHAGEGFKGSVGLTSDYRVKGVSFSERDESFFADLKYVTSGEFYLRGQGWTIAETLGGAEQKVDITAGRRTKLGGVTNDSGVTYKLFPGDGARSFVEFSSEFGSELGLFRSRLGIVYAPEQDNLRNRATGRKTDDLYLFAGTEMKVPALDMALSGHVGRQNGALDKNAAGDKLDWKIGAKKKLLGFMLAVDYVDTDVVVRKAPGRNLAGSGVIFTASRSF